VVSYPHPPDKGISGANIRRKMRYIVTF
jgi:hypothetical protein